MLRSCPTVLLTGSLALAQTILPPPPVPPGNPTTPDKVLLGKALFWDEQLSSSRSVACGTCHVPEAGGADPRTATSLHPGADGLFGTDDDVHGSPGVARHLANGQLVASPLFGVQRQVTNRRAPSVVNAAYATKLFVDGRADDVFRDPASGAIVLPSGAALENQIAGPPVNTTEMAHLGRTWIEISNELPSLVPLRLATQVPAALQQFLGNDTYDAVFTRVFGSPGVTPVRIIFAIAAYERSLTSDQSPFDLWLGGLGTLTALQSAGLARFQTLCAGCHTDLDPAVLATGPVLDDFRNIGVRPVAEDPGRFLVTAAAADRGRFRVPGLRNVALRGSWFHNGSQQTLGQVIDFYARGGDFADNRDPLVDAIQGHIFVADSLQLQALMNALTDPRVANGLPPFDRPRLWSEGPLAHAEFGLGTAGTGGLPLRAEGLGPAFRGNAAFGVGVDSLAPNLFTFLALDVAGSATPVPVLGQHVHLALTPALQILPTGLSRASGAAGFATAVFHVPAGAAVAGTWWLQWIALDPAGPQSLVTSNALRFIVY
ncbi:MAG TPA: cytochrome c peroxidase [Planctomycetota bacterium]